jgi:DNA-binding NtrC family response regulator
VKVGKVLLVSENLWDLLSYSASLTALGYEVEICSSYDNAAGRIERGSFDLVVLSQGSGAFEGRRVLEHKAQFNPQTPIIVVARSLDIHSYLEAMELGAADYLERPEPKDLGWVLQTQLDAGRRRTAA